MTLLCEKHCKPCEGGIPPLDAETIATLMKQVPTWELINDGKEIARSFSFKNFYHTMAFLNAVAWVANQENHHPDVEAGYNYCKIRYTTHAISGLSDNDFICAAKVDALII